MVAFLFTGAYAPLYWVQLACNCLLPQAFGSPAVRRNLLALGVIAVLILAGMWLERLLIIWGTLSHDTMPHHVATVPADRVGLGPAHRAVRPVRLPVPGVPAADARRLHARDARLVSREGAP